MAEKRCTSRPKWISQ